MGNLDYTTGFKIKFANGSIGPWATRTDIKLIPGDKYSIQGWLRRNPDKWQWVDVYENGTLVGHFKAATGDSFHCGARKDEPENGRFYVILEKASSSFHYLKTEYRHVVITSYGDTTAPDAHVRDFLIQRWAKYMKDFKAMYGHQIEFKKIWFQRNGNTIQELY